LVHGARGTPEYQDCIERHERSIAERRKKAEYRKTHSSEIKATEQAKREARWAEERARDARPGVKIGMTAREVEEESNWAYPDHVTRTITADGTVEQWVYRSGRHTGGYLYFHDGLLVVIQE
jgi:hypothetical protein